MAISGAQKRIASLVALLAIGAFGVEAFGWVHRTMTGQYPAQHLSAALQGLEYLGPEGVVLQRGQIDCGPAAIKMVLQHYGMDVALEDLKREMLDDPRGTTMARMQVVAERRGLPAEGRRITAPEMAHVRLPLIALFKRRHYVVVEQRTADGYLTILDPAIGRCRAREGPFLRSCHGEVLLIGEKRVNSSSIHSN